MAFLIIHCDSDEFWWSLPFLLQGIESLPWTLILCQGLMWHDGEGNVNPLQYSCLENLVDRGAWWAAVHGVAQSQTRLKRLSMHAYMHTMWHNSTAELNWMPIDFLPWCHVSNYLFESPNVSCSRLPYCYGQMTYQGMLLIHVVSLFCQLSY